MTLRADCANPLIHSNGGTGGNPEQRFDIIMVVFPKQHGVAEYRMDIGSIEEICATHVDWYTRFFAVVLSTQDGKYNRTRVSLRGLSIEPCSSLDEIGR